MFGTTGVLPTAVMFTLPIDASETSLANFISDLSAENTAKSCNQADSANWNRLIGSTIEFQKCALERDPLCFDEIYPCAQCCRNDVNNFGVSCWDDMYTRGRCCTGATASPIPPAAAPAVLQPALPTSSPKLESTCAKNIGCFDIFYPCDSCCGTGLSIYGQSCWDEVCY